MRCALVAWSAPKPSLCGCTWESSRAWQTCVTRWGTLTEGLQQDLWCVLQYVTQLCVSSFTPRMHGVVVWTARKSM